MASKSEGKYFEAVGRRKTAIARVRLVKGGTASVVNDKNFEDYFKTARLKQMVQAPFLKIPSKDKYSISAKVKGGGVRAQAEAVRHGISRALIKIDPEFRKSLKTVGFLTRDSRMVERKKYGLRKARRAPQWAKR